MHPLPQLLGQLLGISLDARRAHRKQHARLATSLDDALGPRATNLVVRVEDVRKLFGVGGSGWVGEEVFEDEGVLERLAGALALPGRGGVCGVAEQRDAALGESGCDCVVEDGPFGELGAFEELCLRRMLAENWAANGIPGAVVMGQWERDFTSTRPRACGPHPSNIRSSSSQLQGTLHFSCSHLVFSGFTAAMLTILPCSMGELRSARPESVHRSVIDISLLHLRASGEAAEGSKDG